MPNLAHRRSPSGVINDHLHGCFRATDYGATARSR